MTGLARICLHISSTRARAAAGSVSLSSSSISLPWRTSPTPSKPSPLSALPMALPCGSSTPGFRLICTRAFISRLLRRLPHCTARLIVRPVLLHRSGRLEIARAAFRQDAKPARHLLIALLDPAEILAEAVLVHLL